MSEVIEPISHTMVETIESPVSILSIDPFGCEDVMHLANYATSNNQTYNIEIDPILVEKGKRGEKLPENYEIVITERKKCL